MDTGRILRTACLSMCCSCTLVQAPGHLWILGDGEEWVYAIASLRQCAKPFIKEGKDTRYHAAACACSKTVCVIECDGSLSSPVMAMFPCVYLGRMQS